MARRPAWVFTTLGLLAIALLAINLRTPVSSFSPITTFVDSDVPLSSLALGVIGMLPPLCFAAAGFIARPLSQRFSLESLIVASLAVAVVGFGLRALAWNAASIAIGTAISLLGLGIGNVLMPAIVKARFPGHIAPVTSMYIIGIAISASVPPLVAAVFAEGEGWRWSLGFWGGVALCAMIPWIILWVTDRNAGVIDPAASEASPRHATSAHPARSRTAWTLVALFSVCSLNSYAVFAWLPRILVEHSGLEQGSANLLLSWFALVGVPAGFIAPAIASRGTVVRPASFFGIGSFIAGYSMLLALPSSFVFLAVTLLGAGQLLFSVSLALVGLKSATVLGAARLSSFVQGIGYVLAAGGPFLFAMIQSLTGTWVAPIWFLIGTAVVTLPAAYLIGRPNDYEVEAAPASSAAADPRR
ncbi:MFS transporter [Gulosibacter molinativorax]|uniref:MFS transporter n=1 Tax=Gulosibacter molinativorax TaxID=256821 RepID=A0ABT7C998_9MICO|nr:MFS transporter [Gulosibacter molinativorax]MDJ1371796.1 MFS transporter [Gulosibacter molinativorax]QUY60832.1 Putative MFS permease, CynX family [Gulosibacter molinativorax]